jgi:hypothetical protein
MNYDMVIFGKEFSDEMQLLCKDHNIKLMTADLSSDFPNLNNRKSGLNYPIECFYHFYAYKILPEYDYIVLIEPDIYTNKEISIDLSTIQYIGCPHGTIQCNKYKPIMGDYEKISTHFGAGYINTAKVEGGVKIYNVKNLSTINFYEKIRYYYNTSITINAQRNGDESLFVLFQIYNHAVISLLGVNFQYYVSNKEKNDRNCNLNTIIFIHVNTNSKYWKTLYTNDKITNYVIQRMNTYITGSFSTGFIKRYLPLYYSDWQYYISRYPDLQRAGINTEEKAISHWNRFGKKEGRIFTRPVRKMAE